MATLLKEEEEEESDLLKARDSLFAFMDDMKIRESLNLEDLDADSGLSDSDDEAVKRTLYKSPILIKAMTEKKFDQRQLQRNSLVEHKQSPIRSSPVARSSQKQTLPTKVKLGGRGNILSSKSLDTIPKLIEKKKEKKKKKKKEVGWFACCAGDRDSEDEK